MAAAGIAAIGSIAGGLLGGQGAKDAAKQQAKAQQKALSQQAGQFAVTQGNINPWIKAGQADLGGIQDLLGFGGSTGLGSGLSPADQVKFLVSNTTGKSHKQIMQWLAANPNASPDNQLAAVSSLADVNERARWQEYASAAGPYVPAGTPMSANDAQQAAIGKLKASPAFTSLYDTGADTILQNAAATGGLRGGNTNNGLAQFGSSLLAQVIQQQLGNLGSVSGLGAQSGLGLGQISQNNSNAQSQIYGQIGNANAVGAAAPYAALQGIISQLTGGGQASLGNFFGGGSSARYNPANTFSNITAGFGAGG